MKKAFIFFSVAFFISCSHQKEKAIMLPDLTECKAMKVYLAEIRYLDQKYRNKIGEFIDKYGMDSNEYRDLMELMNLTDQENLNKINLIFEQYGYPHDSCLGLSATTPILVLHHTLNAEEREEYLPFLYQNYKKGFVDESMFLLFLDRMYIKRSGNYLQLQGAYSYQQKIDTLLSLMNLNYIKENQRSSE